MARPKIPPAAKKARIKVVPATDEVAFAANHLGKHLADITTKLGAIVDALTAAPAPVAEDIIGRLAALEQKVCACAAPLVVPPGLLDPSSGATVVTKRTRRTNAQIAADNAAAAAAAMTPAEVTTAAQEVREVIQAAAPAAPKADRATCKHPQLAPISTNPKLSRCTACNAVVETPAAQQTVIVPPPPPPAPAAAVPTVDDVRGAAITWIGNHGKDKFAAVLQKYGAANISSVPENLRAALIAELVAG